MRRSLVVLMLLAACGGTVEIGDYDKASLDARCSRLTRCGLFRDEMACHAYFDRTAIDDPNLAAAVGGGKLRYDGDSAKSCFDSLAGAACDSFADPPGACEAIFHGTIANGAACGFSAECESGYCALPACNMACCPGSCAPARIRPAIGEACTFACVDGAYCASDSTCHAVLPQGAACDSALACEPGLYCEGATQSMTGTCATPPKTGQPCTTQCAEIGDVCETTCVAAGLPGDPCATSAGCSPYYRCDATMHCAEMPSLGMPCTAVCSGAAWCNGSTCEAQKANGAICVRNDECQTHFCDRGMCGDVPVCI